MIVDIFSRRLKWVPVCHARTMSLTVRTQSQVHINFSIVHVLPPGKWLPFEQSYVLKVRGHLHIIEDEASCKVTFLPMPDNCPENRLCGVCKNPETLFFRNVIWQMLPLIDVLSFQVSDYFQSRKARRLMDNVGDLWRNASAMKPVEKPKRDRVNTVDGKSANDEDSSSSLCESSSDFNPTVLRRQNDREMYCDSSSEASSEFLPIVLKRHTDPEFDKDSSSETSSEFHPIVLKRQIDPEFDKDSSSEASSEFHPIVLKRQIDPEVDKDSSSEASSEFHPMVLKGQIDPEFDKDSSSETSSEFHPIVLKREIDPEFNMDSSSETSSEFHPIVLKRQIDPEVDKDSCSEASSEFHPIVLKRQIDPEVDKDSSSESSSEFHPIVLKRQIDPEFDKDSSSETSSELSPRPMMKTSNYPTYCANENITINEICDSSSETSSEFHPVVLKRQIGPEFDMDSSCSLASEKGAPSDKLCATASLLGPQLTASNFLQNFDEGSKTVENDSDQLCSNTSVLSPVLPIKTLNCLPNNDEAKRKRCKKHEHVEKNSFVVKYKKGTRRIEFVKTFGNDSNQLCSNTSMFSPGLKILSPIKTLKCLLNNNEAERERCNKHEHLEDNSFVKYKKRTRRIESFKGGRTKAYKQFLLEEESEEKTDDSSSRSSDSDEGFKSRDETDQEPKLSDTNSISLSVDNFIQQQKNCPLFTTADVDSNNNEYSYRSSSCNENEAPPKRSQAFDLFYNTPTLFEDIWAGIKESTSKEGNINSPECKESCKEDLEDVDCSWPLPDETCKTEENGTRENEDKMPCNQENYLPDTNLISEKIKIEECGKELLEKLQLKQEHSECKEKSPNQSNDLLMNLEEICSKLDTVHFNDCSKKTKILEPEQKLIIARLLKSFIKMYYSKHTDVEKLISKFSEEKHPDSKKDNRWRTVIFKPRLINANKIVKCLLNLADYSVDIRDSIMGLLQTFKSSLIADYSIEDHNDGHPPVCFICHKITTQNSYYIERRFGILDKCDHLFCFPCIRNVALVQAHERGIHFNYGPVVCPKCNVESNYLAASKVRYETSENKVGFMRTFQKNMESFLDEDRKYLDVC